jgi:hypothetical protein
MAAKVGKVVWIGRVLSGLVGAFFVMGAVMKLKGGPEVERAWRIWACPKR